MLTHSWYPVHGEHEYIHQPQHLDIGPTTATSTSSTNHHSTEAVESVSDITRLPVVPLDADPSQAPLGKLRSAGECLRLEGSVRRLFLIGPSFRLSTSSPQYGTRSRRHAPPRGGSWTRLWAGQSVLRNAFILPVLMVHLLFLFSLLLLTISSSVLFTNACVVA